MIQACLKHGAKLVFFDNIYMYDGSNLNPITEDLPIKPPSKKGVVRAEIVNRLWQAAEEEGLQACVARAADFYGPGRLPTSVLTETVFTPLSKGKAASWPGHPTYKHSYAYTLDAAKATAILGNSSVAYEQDYVFDSSKFEKQFNMSPTSYEEGIATIIASDYKNWLS